MVGEIFVSRTSFARSGTSLLFLGSGEEFGLPSSFPLVGKVSAKGLNSRFLLTPVAHDWGVFLQIGVVEPKDHLYRACSVLENCSYLLVFLGNRSIGESAKIFQIVLSACVVGHISGRTIAINCPHLHRSLERP